MGFTKVSVDGKIIERVSKMTLKQMQGWIGGHIEVHGDIICNEEGKMLGLPMNVKCPSYVGNIIIKDSDQKI